MDTAIGNRTRGYSLEANNVTTTPLPFKYLKNVIATSGVRTHACYCTDDLKSSPLDLSGIVAE